MASVRMVAARSTAGPFCPWGCRGRVVLVEGRQVEFELTGDILRDVVVKSIDRSGFGTVVAEHPGAVVPPGQAKKDD